MVCRSSPACQARIVSGGSPQAKSAAFAAALSATRKEERKK